MEWLVRKRTGDIVRYRKHLIERAVSAALSASQTEEDPAEITEQVEATLYMKFFRAGIIPTVEQVQDHIEDTFVHRKPLQGETIRSQRSRTAFQWN